MTTWAARQLYRGCYFEHPKWRDQCGQGLRCKVTAMCNGLVYYRPHYGWRDDGSEWLGAPMYFALDDADKYVARPTSPYLRSARGAAN